MKTLRIRNTAFGAGIPKVAVPVTAKTAEIAADKVREAALSGAELIELRADALEGLTPEKVPQCIAAVRRAAGELPLLFTFRTAAEGGAGSITPDEYARITEAAMSGGADLVDIEAAHPRAEALVRRAKAAGVHTVLSNHDFSGTPGTDEILGRLKKMEEAGADIAKCAYMPERDSDVTHVLAAAALAHEELDIPTAAISMGGAGQITRLSGELYGSAFTFGALPEGGSAPGQMDAAKLKQELRTIHEIRTSGRFLFITGFMGSGKSTVSKILSAKTGVPVIEMDSEISQADGRKIPEIFSEDGEEYFRDLETRLLEELYRRPPSIVSCGGGIVLRRENAALMHLLGTNILLTARPETVLQRLRGKSAGRPNIKDRMSLAGVRGLMAERDAYYRAAADYTVATDGKSSRAVAEEIRREYAGTLRKGV